MASSKEKQSKPLPRSLKEIPRNVLTSAMADIPMPVKNECSEKIKTDISNLVINKCLVCTITKDKSLTEWQRYISAICSNYSRKLDNAVKFTIRVIDSKYIGIWRTK